MRRVASRLRVAGVIDRGEFERIGPAVQLEAANSQFYSILDGDPSLEKLKKVSKCLKEDSAHENNIKLARLIDVFLQTTQFITPSAQHQSITPSAQHQSITPSVQHQVLYKSQI